MKQVITGHIISRKLPQWEEYKTKDGFAVCFIAMVEALLGTVPKQVTFELTTRPTKGFYKVRFVGKGKWGHAVILSLKLTKKVWQVIEPNGTFWISDAFRNALDKMGRPPVFYFRIREGE